MGMKLSWARGSETHVRGRARKRLRKWKLIVRSGKGRGSKVYSAYSTHGFPTCQVRVSRFQQRCNLLPLLPSLFPLLSSLSPAADAAESAWTRSGGCGAWLDRTAISRDQEAVKCAWTRTQGQSREDACF